MDNRYFNETRVTSRNIITDWVQSIRNMLGLDLKSYQEAINTTTEELKVKYLEGKNVKWYRLDIEISRTDAFIVTIYGEYE